MSSRRSSRTRAKKVALVAGATLFGMALKAYRWRGKCPCCGQMRHNLASPYGWTCDNPDCPRQTMPKMKKVVAGQGARSDE